MTILLCTCQIHRRSTAIARCFRQVRFAPCIYSLTLLAALILINQFYIRREDSVQQCIIASSERKGT